MRAGRSEALDEQATLVAKRATSLHMLRMAEGQGCVGLFTPALHGVRVLEAQAPPCTNWAAHSRNVWRSCWRR